MWLDIGITRTVSSLEGEHSELYCLAKWSCLNIFRLILCILTGISALLCILFENILLRIVIKHVMPYMYVHVIPTHI